MVKEQEVRIRNKAKRNRNGIRYLGAGGGEKRNEKNITNIKIRKYCHE